jgi:hypothetical protein
MLNRRAFLTSVGAALATTALPAASGCGERARARFLDSQEYETLSALCERILPEDDEPGARALGAADYVDRLLAAFEGPGAPVIYAGGPFSGRHPFPDNERGVPSDTFPPDDFSEFLPLSRLQDMRWRAELFGTAATPGMDFNDEILGPRRGLREIYREGLARVDEIALAELGARFADLEAAEQDRMFDVLESSFAPEPRRVGSFVDIVTVHTLEACFAAPAYGGNRNGRGFAMLGLEGDVQPLGFSIYSRTIDGYVERPDHPMSTPNPDELGSDGSLRPRALSAEGERIQANILTLANLTPSD